MLSNFDVCDMYEKGNSSPKSSYASSLEEVLLMFNPFSFSIRCDEKEN